RAPVTIVMDFGFSDEQEQLRRAVREYFANELPVSFARSMMEDAGAFPREKWQSLAELGWLGLAGPGAPGGSGPRRLHLVLVLEEAGSVVLPGPFVATVSLALPMLLAAADETQRRAFVPEVAGGRRIVACAVAERRGRWAADAIDAVARREG